MRRTPLYKTIYACMCAFLMCATTVDAEMIRRAGPLGATTSTDEAASAEVLIGAGPSSATWQAISGDASLAANGSLTVLTGDSATAFFPSGTIELARGGTGASLVDPDADRVLFWDDTAGALTWLTMGTNLTITGTTLDATAGSTTFDAIGDPGGDGAVAMAETAQTFDWDTAATAAAFDGLTLTITNDSTTDSDTQRLLVLKNVNDAGTQVVERLLVLDNADGDAVTAAIEILGSSTGAVTTALKVDDAEIATALAIGANDVTTAAATIASTELDRLDGLAGIIVTDATAVTSVDGTGLTISGGTLSADLGTTITSSEITDDEIVNADINSAAAISMSKTALVAGTSLTLAGDTVNVDDDFVKIAGDDVNGDLVMTDGTTDSPKVTYTPQTGTSWDIYAEDGADDLQVATNTASEETVDLVNAGAGTVALSVDGSGTFVGALSGSNLSGTNTGDEALSTSSAGVDVSDHAVDLDVTPSSGSATLEQAEDALQVKYDATLTEGASGLGVANDGVGATQLDETEAYAWTAAHDFASGFAFESATIAGSQLLDDTYFIVYDNSTTTSTITLPPAASHDRRLYWLIKINADADLTTIDADGTETIGGDLTVVFYVLGDKILIQSDGSNWQILYDGLIPHSVRMTRDSAQSISNSTQTEIALDSEDNDVGNIGDPTTNNRIDIRRDGDYNLTGFLRLPNFDAGEVAYTTIKVNDVKIAENYETSSATNLTVKAFIHVPAYPLTAGDYVELSVWHNEGASQSTQTSAQTKPFLGAVEVR